MRIVEFWFEFASTYSYPAALRIEFAARDARVEIRWRPFLLGPIFGEQGWRDSPFNIYPAKGRYMGRDLERLCAAYEIPWKRPSVFPRNGLLAARVALAAEHESWLPSFVTGIYRANFADDLEISDPAVVGRVLEGAGRESAEWLERAGSTPIKNALREQTQQALRLGIFGAPSFVVGAPTTEPGAPTTRPGGELFWGNDRLEQALSWATRQD